MTQPYKYQGDNFAIARVTDCDVRCDRQTPYGNPFRMRNKSDQEREFVVNKYRRHVWDLICKQDPTMMSLLRQLWDARQAIGDRPLKLGYWCSPKSCHCDVLAAATDYCFGGAP